MADRVGQRFGDYRLIRFLEEGTFGDVYFGEHVYTRHKWECQLHCQIPRPIEWDGLVSVLHLNSLSQQAPTASVSTHDTSWKPEDFTGRTDKTPVLPQHGFEATSEQGALVSTTSVLPKHGILARNPGHSVGKEPIGELSLSGEPECLSLQTEHSTLQEGCQYGSIVAW